MKKRKNDDLDGLISSMKKWCPRGRPYLCFPEDIRREFEATLAKGRWWVWLPVWALPIVEFADEVAVVAKACRVEPQDLSRRLLEMSIPVNESPVFCWFEPFSQQVSSWEVAQAVESWIFYDLRPALRAVMELELDCRVG